LILVRELDERLGFGELIEQHVTDSRADNARLSLADLLRQSVYSRLAEYGGCERYGAAVSGPDVSADRLRQGPGSYEVLQVELPKSVAERVMRWERLDNIGPSRYGELNQINVPGLRVTSR
jgi:hypothetical protein